MIIFVSQGEMPGPLVLCDFKKRQQHFLELISVIAQKLSVFIVKFLHSKMLAASGIFIHVEVENF